MTVKTPEQWGPDRYKRFVRVEASGRMALTHLAEVVDATGKTCNAYIKHYSPDKPRGLFNEWFGHTLFNALEIAQPRAAIMPAPILGSGAMEWAFVSLVPSPQYEGSAKQLYNIVKPDEHKALIKRLFVDCARSLPGLIAADQLLMNHDRNIGNLLFVSKGRFFVIDFGEILGGSCADVRDLLTPKGWSRSVLIEDLIDISTLKIGFFNAIIAAGQILNENFYSKQRAIMEAIGYPKNNETNVPFDAVWWRTLELDTLFERKFSIIT